jgi:CheY-like chemotaxis protein
VTATQKRILIVDDDPRVRLILRAALERMKDGYEIVAVGGGVEALEHVRDGPFALVISDVRMPGIDGIELAEGIRAMGMDIALIWITAYGCHKLQAEGERLDIDRCLDKPLSIQEIRQAALDALDDDLIPDNVDR